MTWSIVLAGGEGRRLRELTTTSFGVTVPKQFCSLAGGPSLLAETLRRAREVSPLERILVVVSEAHRDFWCSELRALPRENVVVQPESRGTAPGILLPLMRILERDPQAELLVLPSDHHVADEAVLRGAFVSALAAVRVQPQRIALLGMAADKPDTQYGWIVPSGRRRGSSGPRGIALFVEKPGLEAAERLLARGALWSSFVFAARAMGLFEVFSRAQPELVAAFCEELPEIVLEPELERLREFYQTLPSSDFSRDVLERLPERLCVVSVPPCGWSDLGTPDRVATVLGAQPPALRTRRSARPSATRVPILARALQSLAN
jgi:mannose-1-phosphate guanylyltransferase